MASEVPEEPTTSTVPATLAHRGRTAGTEAPRTPGRLQEEQGSPVAAGEVAADTVAAAAQRLGWSRSAVAAEAVAMRAMPTASSTSRRPRSEERRVGKESRNRS